ncbi:MAG: thioredoxin [Clostridium sp.]|uniref:thioredoxin n=1 Tax=Clostridium sp. TaxID=1506 RepID=UPI003064E5B2
MVKSVVPNEFKSEIASGVAVVDFSATWCGPCKMLAPVFEELGKEMEGKAKFFKADVDECSKIALEFKVVSVPTIKIFKDGEVVDTMVGFSPKEVIKAKIEAHI